MAAALREGEAPLLRVRDLSVRFGGIVALDRLSFDVERGTIVGLIGPNGAGKTTLFNCLSRLYDPAEGEIDFAGRSVIRLAPHAIAALGIGRTFQNLALFRSLPVFENVMLGRHCRARGGFLTHALRLPRARREEREAADRASVLVDLLQLTRVAHEPVSALPFGTQKRVELARALASEPQLLLLDEPASGLNHEEVGELVAVIRDIRDRLGVTVLLVEHHMSLVMSVSDKVVALDFGRKIAEGPPAHVRDDAEVIRAYLGTAPAGALPLMAELLRVEGLEAGYGPVPVLHGIDLSLEEGGIATLLGANGAGKTTTLRALCGMVKTRGRVRFRGESIEKRSTEDIARLGIAHVPDGRGTFTDLTTEENLRLGGYVRTDRAAVAESLERMYAYFPKLAERRRQQAGTLSGGEQQMLAVARALMSKPRLLLLDEPSFGLAPLIVASIFDILRTINRDERVGILLVEQNAAMALELADHAFLLETGRIVTSGNAAQMRKDETVRRSYLGY